MDMSLPADDRVAAEAARRRSFAIIAHPDAGKTTLTEKLLLKGGAIQLAGQVRAKGNARRTRSDWMKIEQERGISVATSVMTFEKDGTVFNLLDTTDIHAFLKTALVAPRAAEDGEEIAGDG